MPHLEQKKLILDWLRQKRLTQEDYNSAAQTAIQTLEENNPRKLVCKNDNPNILRHPKSPGLIFWYGLTPQLDNWWMKLERKENR